MRTLLRKTALLALPGVLAVAGWMSLQPQRTEAAQFCPVGKRCFVEGQTLWPCSYLDCWGLLRETSCECVEGRWVCPGADQICPD